MMSNLSVISWILVKMFHYKLKNADMPVALEKKKKKEIR